MKQVLEVYGKWELNRTSQTKYFKNGRPNLHVETKYNIERHFDLSTEQGQKEYEEVHNDRRVVSGYFNVPTKAEIMKVWKQFKKTGVLNGTPVKVA